MKTINSKKRKGVTLIIVIMTMVVLTVLGGTLLNVSSASNKFAVIQENKMQAYYAARSGAAAVANYIIENPTKDNVDKLISKGKSNETFLSDGSKFNVQVNQRESGDLEVVSHGESKGVKQRTTVILSKIGGENFTSSLNYTMAAKNFINHGNSSSGGVNKFSIKGNVAVKSENTDNISNQVKNSVGIKGAQGVPNLAFPEIKPPSDFDKTYSIKFEDGQGLGGFKNSYELNTNSKEMDYKIVDDLIVDGWDLTVTGKGVARIYVYGNMKLKNASINSNEGAKIYIYVVGSGTVEINGVKGDNKFVLYAPNSAVTLNSANDGTIHGSIIADNITLHNQITIEYDEDIELPSDQNTNPNVPGYEIKNWED